MKRLVLFMFLAATAVIFAFKSVSDNIPIGADLPKADVKLKDVSGKEITLKDAMMENGLLVMFSCNTCPYVIKNQQATKDACMYALDKKIGVVLLNSNEGQRDDEDSYEEMKGYANNEGYKWYYAVDKDHVLADAFEAKRTPECFLFNKTGKLVYHGAINDNPSSPWDAKRLHLKEAVNEMLSGKDVAVKETRSVGCGIKRKG
ncbi:MAG: redoxin domain-containing protein [Chitinophagaceae bacterium]|nr:redoxin domain-containing protein [Chitinophagaceae bacterium]